MSVFFTSNTGVCPKCNVLRNLQVHLEHQQILTDDGNTTTIEVATAHCESCGSFVSSESREIGGEDS